VAGHASPQARPRGRHSLRSRAFADELVRDAGVRPGTLVLDLGAGGGILTRALVDAGAHVRAVELDPAAVRQLRTRFGADARVEVIDGDATAVRLPDKPFAVVANLPFAAGTAILRRMLGDPRVPLSQLDAIVEWGLAAKRTAVWPSTQLSCYWSAWYELSLIRRIPRTAFVPPPTVDAGLLRAARREEPLVPVADARRYLAFLQRGFDEPRGLRQFVPRRVLRAIAAANDVSARDIDARQWATLYRQLHGRR
jgi:23S rRNA (adenine-N6)-dimethyltransferase